MEVFDRINLYKFICALKKEKYSLHLKKSLLSLSRCHEEMYNLLLNS